MKTLRLCLISLLFLSLCLQSCDEDDATNTCTGGNFNFLTVGNQWESSFFGSFFADDTLLMAEVLEEPEPGVFKLRTWSEPDNDLDDTYYLQDCGDYMLRSKNLPIMPDDKYMKANRAVGDAWSYTDRVTNVTSNYEVLEKNVSVTTPAGTFVADKISYYQTGAFNTDTMFISNDVFFVKYEGIIQYELISKNF